MPNAVVISYALTFFVALLASWAILAPFFEVDADNSLHGAGEDGRRDLHLKKERVLDALEDLEQDFRTARLTEQDYATAKDELLVEAAECLHDIDKANTSAGIDSSVVDIPQAKQGNTSGRKQER